MSKKSRRRNKRLLALAGLAGALALSKRKGTATGVSGSDKAKFTSDKAYSPPKDTSAKTPTTIQDNKSKNTDKGIPGIRVTKNSITASKLDKNTPNKVFSGPDRRYDYANRASEKNTANIAKPKKNLMATVFPKSDAADEYKAATQDYNRGNYKSGGKVRGCGKALRGFGKAMKGKK